MKLFAEATYELCQMGRLEHTEHLGSGTLGLLGSLESLVKSFRMRGTLSSPLGTSA